MPTPTPNYTTALAAVNPPQPPPAGFGNPPGAIQQAVERALQADELVNVTTVAGGTQAIQGAPLNIKALPAAATPTITNNGTAGGTSYGYKIVAKIGLRPAPASAAGSTATGNA